MMGKDSKSWTLQRVGTWNLALLVRAIHKNSTREKKEKKKEVHPKKRGRGGLAGNKGEECFRRRPT
jgi:hypothetical protein